MYLRHLDERLVCERFDVHVGAAGALTDTHIFGSFVDLRATVALIVLKTLPLTEQQAPIP